MWSIGIYTGDSPFQLRAVANNPVMKNTDVTDIEAEFVADPFMLHADGRWYMFFEVLHRETQRGVIALATSSDGFNWNYEQVVLEEPFHLSYPYVFEWQGEHYMVPETLGASAVCLYKADEFPTRWSRQHTLIAGAHADPSLVRYDDLWWLFTCTMPYQHNVLRLYFARDLDGPWKEHPRSPIVSNDKSRARPAGRILQLDRHLIRFAQDCVPAYGTRVRAFEISKLTREAYVEAEHANSPILVPSGEGWNALGMHHVDAHLQTNGDHGWIACADGRSGVYAC
jgi:beta-xylosidase